MVCGDFVLAGPKCMGEGRVRRTSVNAAREHRFAGDPRVVRESFTVSCSSWTPWLVPSRQLGLLLRRNEFGPS